ncbi:hypothetical protein P154DRAFT_576602 [Amniculicola lignicola CBS 123094]|uniref:Uncharacterized protein n=1 Tax=Amniculicola lignicola CBS 123094 TaxID=1392246 RepID=A0A6A5WIJ9_9PLEO|nr:hypothetical protein P154DRAFT_576602 [Amniculicola lignicola CBS 123094]
MHPKPVLSALLLTIAFTRALPQQSTPEATFEALYNALYSTIGIIGGTVDDVQLIVNSLPIVGSPLQGPMEDLSNNIYEIRRRTEEVEKLDQAWER